MPVADQRKRAGFRAAHVLLALPFAAVLWVPFYNRIGPELWGIPFFYWYQLFWIPFGAALLYPVYRSSGNDP